MAAVAEFAVKSASTGRTAMSNGSSIEPAAAPTNNGLQPNGSVQRTLTNNNIAKAQARRAAAASSGNKGKKPNGFEPVIGHLNKLSELLDELNVKLGGRGTKKPTINIPLNNNANSKPKNTTPGAAVAAANVANAASMVVGAANKGNTANPVVAEAANKAAAAAVNAAALAVQPGNGPAAAAATNNAAAATADAAATAAAAAEETEEANNGPSKINSTLFNGAASAPPVVPANKNALKPANKNVGNAAAANTAAGTMVVAGTVVNHPVKEPLLNLADRKRLADINNGPKSGLNAFNPPPPIKGRKPNLEQGNNGFVAAAAAKIDAKKGGRRSRRRRHSRRRHTRRH
jgi:hypothetical protein